VNPEVSEVRSDGVHLALPAPVEGRAGREQLLPLFVGKPALDALLPVGRLVVDRPLGRPGQRDKRALAELPFGFGDHLAPRADAVVALGCIAEIGNPEGRPFAGGEAGLVGVLDFAAGVLAWPESVLRPEIHGMALSSARASGEGLGVTGSTAVCAKARPAATAVSSSVPVA